MSKIINIQDTYTSNTVSFDESNSDYYSEVSGYPAENGIGDGTGTYAGFVLKTGSSAVTNVYYNFDCSGIPSGSTITSVECRVRASRSSTQSNRIASAYLQLCTGTTTKGSETSVATTTATYFDLTCGSWTLAELQNAKIRFRATRGTSSTSSTSYSIRFFGAVLTVEYTFQGTAYTITAASSLPEVEVEPATQDIISGDTGTIIVHTDTLDNIKVLDNSTEVTNQLVRKTIDTGGTSEQAPASYTTSGSISGTRYTSAIGHTVENPSTQTGNDYCSSSGSTATIYYHFDFTEIPENATIDSMSVQVIGHLESTSQAREVAELNTYYGTTAKGTQTEFTSTSAQTVTISPGTWTTAELRDDARVGFTIGYYGGLVLGITWSVTYSVASSGDLYYYEYTLSNVSADHVIVIEQAGAVEPPEEDPQYNYYPITISAINATTDPGIGTTRVQEGTNQTITISPTDPKLTLALDNGVDITSQLVGGTPTNTFTVNNVTGSDYDFTLNYDGYYESTNQDQNNSAALARVNLQLETECIVTFSYINYAEATYDYGVFGQVDNALSTNYTADSDAYLVCSTSAYNSPNVQTVTYTVNAGSHFIDVKYIKDTYTSDNNDSLQFKVSIEASGAGGDYTYTLSNINTAHSLIFVFGDVEYYFITSSGTNAKLFPDGQMVKLAGDVYVLTVIPDDVNATVTLTDNNLDKTSLLERLDGTDKTGNSIVNYVYKLQNITATHTIIVNCTSSTSAKIYVKINDTWRAYSKVYLKVNGSWVEQDSSTWSTLFDTDTNYRLKE